MENELFSWDGWDQNDTMNFNFYYATLKVNVGDYKAGDAFSCITMDYENGSMELFSGKESKSVGRFKLSFRVGRRLPAKKTD